MITTKTDRNSGLRFTYAANLAGEKEVFIDLDGNSYSFISMKRAKTFAKFLRDTANQIEKWGGK